MTLKLYIVGKIIEATKDPKSLDDIRWKFVGVYTERKTAIQACKFQDFFYFQTDANVWIYSAGITDIVFPKQ